MKGLLRFAVKAAIVVGLIMLFTRHAKCDSISLSAGIADASAPSYGVTIQHDWNFAYINLQNDIAGDASYNTTTIAVGGQALGLNLGIFGGDQFVSGKIVGTGGLEAGFTLPLGSSSFFVDEDTRFGRCTGSSVTNASASVGFGIKL